MAELHMDLYRAAVNYLSNKYVPLPLTATKQELQADLQVFVANVQELNVTNLLPEGSQLRTLPAEYLWKMLSFTILSIDTGNEEKLRLIDAQLRQAQGMPADAAAAPNEELY